MSLKAIATSAFGRRTVTRAQIAAQLAVDEARARREAEDAEAVRAGRRVGAGQAARTDGEAVHKWALLRILSEIRETLGVSDRSLGVLSALMSFHPETALTLPRDDAADSARAQPGAVAGLVVFPSNRALSLRCNGMSEATLRRHLAALVEAGLIIRRDSPNGKRYARRGAEEGRGEEVVQAFGFDLSPLVARASAFSAQLEAVRAERRRAHVLKERVVLLRRDVSKRIAFALDEGLSGPWEALRTTFLSLSAPLRAVRRVEDFVALAEALDALALRVAQALANALQRAGEGEKNGEADARRVADATADLRYFNKTTGDAAHFERRHTESNSDPFEDFDPPTQGSGGEIADQGPGERGAHSASTPTAPEREPPLRLVLDACPDIAEYAFAEQGLADWSAFVEAARAVRPMLGVSPDAWREAVAAMGERQAAAAIAFLLQRCEHSSEARRHLGEDGRVSVTVNGSPAIRAPGGYLRALTQKARDGGAPLWSALLAHLAQRRKVEAARAETSGGAGGRGERAPHSGEGDEGR